MWFLALEEDHKLQVPEINSKKIIRFVKR